MTATASKNTSLTGDDCARARCLNVSSNVIRRSPVMPISDDITDNLTVAVARWVTAVAREVVTHPEKAKALDACLNAEEADLRVTLRLRAGVITFEGTNEAAGKYVELYRQHVEPLRPQTGCGGAPGATRAQERA